MQRLLLVQPVAPAYARESDTYGPAVTSLLYIEYRQVDTDQSRKTRLVRYNSGSGLHHYYQRTHKAICHECSHMLRCLKHEDLDIISD